MKKWNNLNILMISEGLFLSIGYTAAVISTYLGFTTTKFTFFFWFIFGGLIAKFMSFCKKLYDLNQDSKYRLLWESACKQGDAIIAELDCENEEMLKALKQINASDDSSYNARIAHEVLKKIGKL